MGTIRYTWLPAQAFTPGRGGKTIRTIVLHSACGSLAGDLATLTGPKVSAHWYVARDGRIWHMVQDADTAYHAGRVRAPQFSNAQSIGIETEHRDGEQDWPLVQVAAIGRLVAFLRQRHGDEVSVLSHAFVAAPHGRKTDPVAFPWTLLSRAVAQVTGEAWCAERVEDDA